MESQDQPNPQEQALQDSLVRGSAFEGLIRTEGWKFVQAYYQAKVQAFASQLLVSDKDILEFEAQRRELKGLRNLLSFIENDLKVLHSHEETKRPAKQ